VEPLDRELLHVTRALCAVAAGWFLMGLPHSGECLLEQAADVSSWGVFLRLFIECAREVNFDKRRARLTQQ
jgi:hypothetical protein